MPQPEPNNGSSVRVSVEQAVGLVLQDIEEQLMGRPNPSQRLALERAQQHLYEGIYWIGCAQIAAGRIITP